MKVALAHDYLREYGGAERVLEALCELYPEAPIFTSYTTLEVRSQKSEVRESFIRYLPFVESLGKLYTPLFPLAFESFDLREYDVIISSTTMFAKGVLTKPRQLHVCYCHTPPRFLYGLPDEMGLRCEKIPRFLLSPLDNYFRKWDFASAQRPDYFVTNSQHVAKRIDKFYRREAKVIYPPVSPLRHPEERSDEGSPQDRMGFFADAQNDDGLGNRGSYFLVVSRLSRYKNVDLAIKACKKLNLSLKIVGGGQDQRKLKRIAGPTVGFLGRVSDAELSGLYSNCKALIFPVEEEDFGMVAVEAMACGKPVIALRSGGLPETIVEGKTGVFFDEPAVESLVSVLSGFEKDKFNSKDCVKQAEKFSADRFKREFKGFVEECWSKKLSSYPAIKQSR